MTSKDFTALADALSKADDLNDAVRRVANVCNESNPNFNLARFMLAATPKDS